MNAADAYEAFLGEKGRRASSPNDLVVQLAAEYGVPVEKREELRQLILDGLKDPSERGIFPQTQRECGSARRFYRRRRESDPAPARHQRRLQSFMPVQ